MPVCLIGGLPGLALALGAGFLAETHSDGLRLNFTLPSILVAFLSSAAIGLTFGYLPARSAARLHPVVALSRD